MYFILIPLAVVLAAGLYLLRKLSRAGDYRLDQGVTRVVIVVRDQESWVEGIIRKAFHCLPRTPLRVQVADHCSRDGTPDLLRRLQRHYPFEILTRREAGGESVYAGTLCLDFRGLKGRELLQSPLFSRLSRLNEGKSYNLSK